jgi:hypothetical protein
MPLAFQPGGREERPMYSLPDLVPKYQRDESDAVETLRRAPRAGEAECENCQGMGHLGEDHGRLVVCPICHGTTCVPAEVAAAQRAAVDIDGAPASEVAHAAA